MDEIAKAFAAYASTIEKMELMKENGLLGGNTDAALYAFNTEIYYQPPVVLKAFVAVMEVVDAARQEKSAPKHRKTEVEKMVRHEENQQALDLLVSRAKELASANGLK